MEQEKKKKFKLFDWNRDGKGVEKEEIGPPNLRNFFKLWGRKFTKLLSVNLYMLLGIVPAVFIAYLFFTGEKTPSALSPLYPALWGASQVVQTPALAPLFGVHGLQFQLPFMTPGLTWSLIGLAVVWLLTWGYVNVGTTYILRSLVRREPVFMWSDFWYAIRRNKVQGMLVGAIDLIVMGVLVFDLYYFYGLIGSFAMDMMFFLVIALLLIYNFMRYYLYLMLITFDLKLGKLIKNAFIFAIVGIKRNVMALIGMVVLGALNYLLIALLAPLGLIVVVILPLVYYPACAAFMSTYAAWAKIEELMIKPYHRDHPEEDPGDDDGGEMMPDPDMAALM